jgi:hypothetical protein
MKRIFSLLMILMLSTSLLAQKTQYYDLIIQKTTPKLHLYGYGGILSWNNDEVRMTHTSNKLTITGGILISPNFIFGYTTTGTTTTTTTLNNLSTHLQYFTGSQTQTVKLPVVSTLTLGQQYTIINNSSGLVTIQSSGSNTILIMNSQTEAILTCVLISGTDAASWNASYKGIVVTTGKKFSVSNTLTLVGTDATTMTFPTTSATIARTDAANNFIGNQGLGTETPQHKLSVITDPLTKLNAFNFVNTVNKRRDTPQQAADTSSLNMSFTTTGSPMLSLTSKTGTNLLYIDSSKVSTTLDFAYGMKHAIGSADSIAYSTGTTQNQDYKINTTAFTWRENDGFTAAGDSIRILTTGDYEVHIWVAATTSNANDKLRVRLYVNNLRLASTSFGRMLINSNGSGNAETHYFLWYKEFTANDYISWRIANETGARASVVSDIKVYVKKVPEN